MWGRSTRLAVGRLAFRVALAGLTIAPAALLAAQGPFELSGGVCTWENLNQATMVGSLDFQAYKDEGSGNSCLEIRRGGRKGKVLFRQTVESYGEYRLGQPANPQYNIAKIENGTDIIGRGRPNMIVTNWSGGAHCCFVHFVFELEPALKLVARLDDGDGDLAHFADLDGNGHYYYVGNDWTFAYWNASFAASPAPLVVLRFVEDGQGGGYHLAMDKMQRPAPTPEEWKKEIGAASDAFSENSGFGDGIGSELWSNMLNLIYTGHSELAWKLFDEAWPAHRQGKITFLSGFCSQLKTSAYWPELEKTIPSAPPSCANAKAEAPVR